LKETPTYFCLNQNVVLVRFQEFICLLIIIVIGLWRKEML